MIDQVDCINAVQYGKLKHNVNKSDRRVSALLGSDTWEQLRATLDMTTNDNIGSVAEQIIQDKDLSPQEKGAILEYMENSLILRGFNMAGFAQSRNKEQNPDEQQLNESYIDGYTSSNPEEMANIKTMFNIKQNAIANILDAETIEYLNDNPINGLVELRESGLYTQDQINTILDYLNAKQVYDGMMQSVNDNIDDKIAESNAIISARINKSTGMIQGAKHKVNDRQVYVIYGNVVPYQDGTGIDVTQSDNTIVIRDAETGKIEQISPADLSLIDEAIDPLEQQQIAADAIREQDTQEASSKIDGIITFNQGDKYLIPVAEGYFYEWTIVPNDKGLTENEDGTVNVFDGLHVYPVSKEDLQLLVNKGREIQIQESEKQRYEENKALEEQTEYPKYEMGKSITIRDDNGNMLRGSVEEVNEDGVLLAIENPETGYWNTISYNADDLNSRLVEYDGVEYNTQNNNSPEQEVEEPQVEAPVETITEDVISEQPGTEQGVSALERIPKDEQGNPIYEMAENTDVAWDAIVEQTDGDETMAQTVADSMLADKKAELKKAEKAKSKGGVTIAEKIASEKERQAAIDKAKAEVDFWQSVVDTKKRRAEELKRAEEEQKLAEEEQRRAEEEARRLAEEQRLAEERKAEENVPTQEDNTELSVEEKITEAEGEVDTNPTEAQKQAGNYKKGHVKIDGYDVTIENPKGSVRSGTDASGKEWSITMNNTYGYIRGTEGVDGDHIDVFFSENPSQGDVFVIDQVNKDGSFDEHKVMYGFSSEEEARQAYLSNYEEGWQGLGAITHVTKEDFKKWIESSHRKTKPFAEYKSLNTTRKNTENTKEVEQQVNSSYVEKQWSENDDVEEMKQRLEYLSKATEIGSKEEKEIFPEYEQFEADKNALLEKYNGNVPKEKQVELLIKYKDFVDRRTKVFNEISSLRIAILEAEEKASTKAKEQSKQEKLDNIQNSYNGYLKGLSNLVASRLDKALSKKVNIDGEVKTIAEFIEEWQKNGNLKPEIKEFKSHISRSRWNKMSQYEQEAWEKAHEKGKTAYLINGYDLGKTAYDYANWLLSNKSTQQVQETKSEAKPTIDPNIESLVDKVNKEYEDYYNGVGDLNTYYESEKKLANILKKLSNEELETIINNLRDKGKYTETIKSILGDVNKELKHQNKLKDLHKPKDLLRGRKKKPRISL